MPSIEVSTLEICTNCPGIAPWAPGVVISNTLEPDDKLLIGSDPRDSVLLILLLVFDSADCWVVAIIWGDLNASASALALILLVFSSSFLIANLPALESSPSSINHLWFHQFY